MVRLLVQSAISKGIVFLFDDLRIIKAMFKAGGGEYEKQNAHATVTASQQNGCISKETEQRLHNNIKGW